MASKTGKGLFTIIFMMCCFMTAASISIAAEYYVAPTGDDTTGAGSMDNPYRTIQHTLDNVAASGDAITLRAGTYNENIRIRMANITIQSMAGEWAVIEAPINDENKVTAVIFDVDSDGGALRRVEVIGGYWYGIKFNTKWDEGDPNDRSGACNITIEDCVIHDTGQACVKVTPGCDDITIRRCEIYNSGRRASSSAEAIDNVNGDRMRVEECYIHDITATGLYAKGGADGTVIERCLVENCGEMGILLGFDTSPEFFDIAVNPDYYENIDGAVTNCVVVNTQYAGVGVYAAKNAKVYNNTLVDVAQSGQAGIYFGLTFQDWESGAGRPPSVNPIIRNNIVVQSSMNPTVLEIKYDDENDELGALSGLDGMPVMSNNRYYVKGGAALFEDERSGYVFRDGLAQWQSHISGDAGSTEGDPGFADPASGDYHLTSSSACVDAGTPDGAPSADYDEVARPRGSGYDAGAYEYVDMGYPVPDIRANGSNDPLSVSFGSPVAFTISLDPGAHTGQNADWWIAAAAPDGVISYFDISSLSMVQGFSPTWQGGLLSLGDTPFLSLSDLSAGTNTFVFGVDMTMNGLPDIGSLYYDMVQVEVASGAGPGHITYTLWNDQVYRVKAEEGATPENISLALDALSPRPAGGGDRNLNISPDGEWLILETERFDPDCAGWSCLAVVAGDLSSGDVIRANGALLRASGEFPVIASGG
ncbi:MAG: right-handed parallel beta-helix repeat-containing protein, partial [Desulfobacterales bacterium]|nr:right-handed parallel beta-helix repeat-containing protein [Desulfobacterales bacterium]